ncbi:serine/threonine-protein kinase [Streptomyces sp. NPDC058405]|uniref:serine/threonine-protein kinase n=1 Tax=Streptomyces sp. NPDC058405 TaxID=3346482 RepID=UPI00364F15CC
MSGVKIMRLGEDDPATLGSYRIIGRLGSGGMGRIYLARSADRRLVAVKTLLAEGLVSDTDRRRFAREVALAQRVDSGYTARVLDADAEAARPWMAIEYIAAPSLDELVRTAGHPPASAVRWVGAGVAAALVALHGQGIVHRDIKPPNVLLPLNGPRVIDFGISHASDLTRTSLTLGTIAFTSPEQARGEPSTAASDIYSLGATLFHLAVGRPPYAPDGDTLGLLARVSRSELDLSGLPRELNQLIRSCLAADPAGRPQPADVLAQFKSGLVGLPVSESGSRWLPPRWTALIEAYDRQGRTLREGPEPGAGAEGAHADDPAADDRTRGVRGPGPTRQYTRAAGQEEEEEKQRREKERAAREQERAAREHDRAERERAERRAERERRARERAEARAEQESAARKRAEREGQARTGPAAAAGPAAGPRASAGPTAGSAGGSSAGQTAGSASGSTGGSSTGRTASANPSPTTPAATAEKSSSGWGWLLIGVAVLMFIWQPWDADDSTSGSSSSGGSSYSSYTDPAPTPAAPTPNETDLAFLAVDTGDCLSSHDDGRLGWNDPAPERVDCDAADAYNRVAFATSDSDWECDTDADEEMWSNVGDDSVVTTLCLTRRYEVGQCFIAKADSDGAGDGNLRTVWSCGADTVPEGYSYVMQITGYHAMPSDESDVSCRRYQNDTTRYSWYEVDGGEGYVCSKIVD